MLSPANVFRTLLWDRILNFRDQSWQDRKAQLGARRNLQDKTTKTLFLKTKSVHALKVSCPLVELWLVNWLPHIITKHRSRLSMWHIAYVLCPRMQTTESARRPNTFAADYCRNGPCFTQLKMDHNMMQLGEHVH